ncbi:tRNA adenosine(34) deaminase TadA [Xenophilus arseniciresistens]|uniref:tRNA-specific adenosine deaminase n=2 Tax=Xenophilus arseniciresistens TaxID=1283306 RepID=A0AAE3SX50_9BURK|nr:tRNA adenosine(34) deaminase TadA [Xenophilus arseniciresistens]MDA7414782.1 tRNA adenosine(34) deaminase TadA [Xenophilus arseniciresistens]
MRLALAQAQAAAEAGEVPVGAVVVRQGQLLATGRNTPIAAHDPTGHAEVNALRAAAQAIGNYRLEDCELFVTLEPCPMCAGAMLHARLARVVFGAADPRTGAAGSVLDLFAQPALNPHTEVQGGLLAQECAQPLQAFFQTRRAEARARAQPLRDDALRTPEARFDAFAPPAQLRATAGLPSLGGLRMVWLDNEAQLAHDDTQAAVLCLHGPGQWGALYQGLWARLPRRRLLVPDLIGHGRSDKPKKSVGHDIAWHARVLDEWLDAQGLGPVQLVFHPAQAGLAQLLAGQAGRVASLHPLPATALHARGTPDWLAAPYPDRGHMAALSTWGLTRPLAQQLTQAGLDALVRELQAGDAAR